MKILFVIITALVTVMALLSNHGYGNFFSREAIDIQLITTVPTETTAEKIASRGKCKSLRRIVRQKVRNHLDADKIL